MDLILLQLSLPSSLIPIRSQLLFPDSQRCIKRDQDPMSTTEISSQVVLSSSLDLALMIEESQQPVSRLMEADLTLLSDRSLI